MPQATPNRQAGETLIELLVTIMVMGIAGTAVAGGLLMAIDASVMHRQQSEAERYLRTWAEQTVALTDADYPACSNTGWYAGRAPSAPSGWSFSVGSVEVWDSAAEAFAACGSATDVGVQRATLSVTSPGAGLPGSTRTVDVVVRRPCAGTTC